MRATTRLLRLVTAPLALAVLSGCPSGEGGGDAHGGALHLTLAEQVSEVDVGESAKLELSFAPGQSEQHQYLFGAMIAGEESQRVTQWHAAPPDAVRFDGDTLTATFEEAGTVTIWATWEGEDGEELRSNDIQLRVRADGKAVRVTPGDGE